MLEVAYLIPALPLVGFLVLVAFGKRLGDPRAGWVATIAMGLSFLASVATFAELVGHEGEERSVTKHLFTWMAAGGFEVDVGFLVDPLSVTMALFVTGVGALIHLYSIGYMHGDERYHQYFVYLNLFAFSMLVLVLGDSLLLTFVGWEGVGACSYLLISFWFERPTAAVAGKKAFVTNRIGDFGFLVAMMLIFASFGTLEYLPVLERVDSLAAGTATAIALLLFLGAVGKSAQLPLYVWLPDAMEGPTPVSALIHAATMVTAGVFLMVRVNPILAHAGDAAIVVAVVGALTALFAATIACAQNDIKRVLAYSTISQLGYMFLAVGTGAYVAAVFHMVTHAFFKALLFLGAGSVMHGLHDEQDMKRMGGLLRWMRVTGWTFVVGWLAIAGIPPFSGFWSKDDILANAWDKSPLLWAVGAVTALLTAYYMSRQVFLVFGGRPRWEQAGARSEPQAEAEPEHEPAPAHAGATGVAGGGAHGAHGSVQPHESPPTMTLPLVVLALLAAAGGAINLPFHGAERLHHWLEPVFEDRLHHLGLESGAKLALVAVAVGLALAGVAAAYAVVLGRRVREEAVEPAFLRRGWYVDDLYRAVVETPGRVLSGWSASFVDRKVIDGAVNGVAGLVGAAGSRLRVVQSGFVRNYALAVLVGVVGVLGFLLARGGGV